MYKIGSSELALWFWLERLAMHNTWITQLDKHTWTFGVDRGIAEMDEWTN